MIFSCVVPFKRKKKKILNLSLPPWTILNISPGSYCSAQNVFGKLYFEEYRLSESCTYLFTDCCQGRHRLVVANLFEDLSSSRQPIVCSQPVNNYVNVFRTAAMADNQCFADSQLSVRKLNVCRLQLWKKTNGLQTARVVQYWMLM